MSYANFEVNMIEDSCKIDIQSFLKNFFLECWSMAKTYEGVKLYLNDGKKNITIEVQYLENVNIGKDYIHFSFNGLSADVQNDILVRCSDISMIEILPPSATRW